MQWLLRVMRAELLIDRLRHLSLTLICALTALVPHAALSHGPAPAPLAVLSFDASGERAALVRTSIGLAKDYPPADWTYVCPSQFGDREQARASYLEASQTTLAVGGGAIYRSNDGACTFEAVTQEDESYALDVSAIAGAFWLIALDEGKEGRVLLRVTAEGPAQRIKAFQGEGALRVDSIAALGGSGLIAVASSPSPTLIFGLGDEADPATLTWSSVPLADLPESTSHLELRRVSPEGEVWMVAATEAGRELWHGAPSETLGEGPRAWRRVDWYSVEAPQLDPMAESVVSSATTWIVSGAHTLSTTDCWRAPLRTRTMTSPEPRRPSESRGDAVTTQVPAVTLPEPVTTEHSSPDSASSPASGRS